MIRMRPGLLYHAHLAYVDGMGAASRTESGVRQMLGWLAPSGKGAESDRREGGDRGASESVGSRENRPAESGICLSKAS